MSEAEKTAFYEDIPLFLRPFPHIYVFHQQMLQMKAQRQAGPMAQVQALMGNEEVKSRVSTIQYNAVSFVYCTCYWHRLLYISEYVDIMYYEVLDIIHLYIANVFIILLSCCVCSCLYGGCQYYHQCCPCRPCCQCGSCRL